MSRFGKDRKVERPSHKQLKEDIENMSMVAVGRKYGVSDNAVRKWIKRGGLEPPKMYKL